MHVVVEILRNENVILFFNLYRISNAFIIYSSLTAI